MTEFLAAVIQPWLQHYEQINGSFHTSAQPYHVWNLKKCTQNLNLKNVLTAHPPFSLKLSLLPCPQHVPATGGFSHLAKLGQ